ncbi:CDP-diacylglycerol--serine O-phosphatidyltransferase [Candidatus Woesearchaeota archaeon]|jgi:CDP-diacylglycerol---serine O-phosphatidyltransferase|nr:CDP-diacylglycerol--serine O-phosphatidyltransferase [Candidatus Woesearchaeota archaeon]MBT3538018.1 CDP-diacylglycerol--serine O-phosphatidyltransferase [Candidatus Woesearchaeota archaeon]MBT4698109.1 CDP-diacylglycerol--serine O-phosphatidyltransferase [Candidatus Woesearchaeota archaeon]MBT4717093.1 CDP-diacylglycerol--serine O-phosphatidyltransferase [Candidatus Woesearchaeota archaeon]MBT7105687.1 CDP-diacylglycerol--serine O-phosphatidyltransferase [Candidatus Woesearchaeota archaeon
MRKSKPAKRLSRNIRKVKPKIRAQKKNIPTVFTLANLALGFFAIISIFNEMYNVASLLILIGFIFDILDGMMARYLSVASDFGVELDSLADAVTFVLTPSLLVFFYFFQTTRIGILVSLFVLVCGILRLAKFNTMKTKDHFVGMPTPFFAAIVISFIFLKITLTEQVAAIVFFILAYLMVSPIQYPSFKQKNMKLYKYFGIGIMALMAIAFLLKLDIFYIAIGENLLLWVAVIIPLFFNKMIKVKTYLFVFAFGLALATIAFYHDPRFLIVLPFIYSIAAAPLLIIAFNKKVKM